MDIRGDREDNENYYIVAPAISTMRVPILRDPSRSQEVISYLKAGTMVKVISRSELWLCIELPSQKHGYIQLTSARPATSDETQALSHNNARGQSSTRPSSVISTSAGLTRNARASSPGLRAMGSLLILFVGLGTLGSILGSVVEQTCYTFVGCTDSHPFMGLSATLIAIAVITLIIGLIIGLITWLSHASRH